MSRATRNARASISLDDPVLVAAGVPDFIAVAYPGAQVTAALRELVLRGVGGDPLAAATTAARRAAYTIASLHYRRAVMEALKKAEQDAAMSVEIAIAEYQALVEEARAQARAEGKAA